MATPILVTGAAGRVGGIGRSVTELLLAQGRAVRAMVRTDDQRAQALRDTGAEVVVGDLLDLDSMHRAIAGCETMYFGMSVSDAYLAATVNAAAVAKHHGVKAFINMSQMTLAQMSVTETTSLLRFGRHRLELRLQLGVACDALRLRKIVLLAPVALLLEGGDQVWVATGANGFGHAMFGAPVHFGVVGIALGSGAGRRGFLAVARCERDDYSERADQKQVCQILHCDVSKLGV